MKISFRVFLCTLMVTLSLLSFSQKNSTQTFTKVIGSRFAKQWSSEQQEKAYLHTDKPYYSAGEDIWFKGYVVNATTHIPKSLSRFLYVELIDKSNAVITRVKIKKDSLGFSGCLKLLPELKAGDYALRAYTYWMQNATPDFFFSKNIYIGNAIDDFVKSQITYGKTSNGKIIATISFNDANRNPVSGKIVDVFQNWNNPQSKKTTQTTNKDGKINVELTVDSTNHTLKVIDVSMSEPGSKYKTRFFMPEFGDDFDVQFFPESGPLLSGELQVVGFKAVGVDGISVDVTGKIYTSKGQDIAEFSSLNKGMGKFTLEPEAGETYYAVVKSSKGVERKFNLPVAVNNGIALHLVNNRGKIYYEMKNRTGLPNDRLYLLVHSRGRALAMLALKDSVGQVSEALLPPGVVSFSVIDTLYNTYCERLFFVTRTAIPAISMKSDKPVYGKRQAVNLDLNIQSATGKPALGNFSISITDSKTVKLDSLVGDILSYLLLSSDIKGYIEEPGSYFLDNSMFGKEKLDVLMLTQGWKRFSTAAVVKANFKDPAYYMEVGQALTGKVLDIFNKPAKKCGIIMLSPMKGMIKLAQTDSLGHYLIDGFEFADSTSFVLKAKREKGFGDVEIVADPDVFPVSSLFIPTTPLKTALTSNEYLQQSKEKNYSDGGMRVVDLGEVTVKAAKINKNETKHYYDGSEDVKMTSEKLEDYPGMGVLEILSMMAGIQVNGDQVSIRGSMGNPLFLIDEIESLSMDDITYLTSSDIESISVFKGANAAIFGSKGGNGVVAIALKKGFVRKADTPISMTTATPLGFQKPTAFYVPKYNVDSVRLNRKSDLRTTIYWNPKLISDSTGTVHVKFYSADKPNNYSVVMEGISNTGEIFRFVGVLRREGEK